MSPINSAKVGELSKESVLRHAGSLEKLTKVCYSNARGHIFNGDGLRGERRLHEYLEATRYYRLTAYFSECTIELLQVGFGSESSGDKDLLLNNAVGYSHNSKLELSTLENTILQDSIKNALDTARNSEGIFPRIVKYAKQRLHAPSGKAPESYNQ